MILPTIKIDGDYSSMLNNNKKAVLPFTLTQDNRTIKGFVQMEWQGNSSKSLPKKGFKFKTYADQGKNKKLKFQPTPLMYRSHNFQLKGYYTDKYGIRDLAAAEILTWFIANNPTASVELLRASHFGTTSGMPCLLYFGEEFYGLMSLKTHTSSTMFNLDEDNPDHIAIESNGQKNSKWTSATPTLADNGDFTLESDNDTKAQAALTTLANFIVNSSDTDFAANLEKHVDVNSLCDYILFNFLINNTDAWTGKNEVLITYDGVKWFAMPYDFDSSMNSHWRPGTVTIIGRDYFKDYFEKNVDGDRLLYRVIQLFPDKLLSRFNYLEKVGVLDITRLQSLIDQKITEIGQGALAMEWDRWSDNPAYQLDTPVDDIKRMFIVRKKLLKDKLEAMQK